jgi:hypothetical protein
MSTLKTLLQENLNLEGKSIGGTIGITEEDQKSTVHFL